MRKIKVKYIVLIWIALAFIVPAIVVSIDLLTDGYRLNSGEVGLKVDATSLGSVCRTLTNNSGVDYFVPTKTKVEWEAFLSGIPDYVIATECLCGNGTVDYGEECDGTGIYNSCSSINQGLFSASMVGFLSCDGSCQYDESDCTCIGDNVEWYNNYGCNCTLGYLNCDASYSGFTGNGCETPAGTYYNGCCGDGICNVPADGATYAEAVSICPADCGCGNGICNYTASGENPDGYCYQDCEDDCLGGVPSLDCVAPDTCLSIPGVSSSFCGQ